VLPAGIFLAPAVYLAHHHSYSLLCDDPIPCGVCIYGNYFLFFTPVTHKGLEN
jgi:hypothetical protein